MIHELISMLIAFLTVLFITPSFIRMFNKIGLTGTDQHKKEKPLVPISQGIPVAFGFMAGLFFLIAVSTFITGNNINISILFASMLTVLIITAVGFFDDIFMGKKKEISRSGTHDYRIGIRQSRKALLILPAAIPLMIINAGHSVMSFPFIGTVDLGLIYPLLLIPIGVLCVSNAYNMLGGINGIESGMAMIALLGLGVFTSMIGAKEASLIAFVSAAAFLGMMKYAKVPSRIMAGDSATYLAGALIATVVIVGSVEKFGFIVFLPWVAEAFIKLKGKFQGTSLGKLTEKGHLKPLRGRIESLTHVIMNAGNFTEKQIMFIFIAMELGCVALAFGFYYTGII